MVQKIHPRGVILVPSNRPQAGHLLENFFDDLAVQYEDVHDLVQFVHKWCIWNETDEWQ